MGRNHEISEEVNKNLELEQFRTSNMDKARILELLRERGFRVTKQREILIDIILGEECTCCKEIYYLAAKKIQGIGIATIYRTIGALEEIGALKRKKPYHLCCQRQKASRSARVELEDSSVVELDPAALHKVLEIGLIQCGYTQEKGIKSILWGADLF